MAKSPAVILFDSAGVAMAIENGVAIPLGTRALLAAGSDGTAAHVLLLDSAGRPIVAGAGAAGSPLGGVVSIQGVAGGTAVPISGTVAATNPSVGANNAAAPASSAQVGGSDGTNLQAARVFDVDSGAGSQYVLGVGLRKAGSGGSVEAGTASDPLRVDPTGTTTQPISADSLPLPTGAATQTTLSSRLAETTFTGRINTFGQKAMAASTPVVIASDQTSLPISDNGGSLTVDGTVTANIGTAGPLALDATLTGGTARQRITDGTSNVAVKAASSAAVATDPALVVAVSPNNTVAVTAAALPLPTGAATETTLATRLAEVTFTTRVPTLGQKVAASSTPVVLASDQPSISVADGGGSLTVDGAVTANIGTTNGLALDATLIGGLQSTRVTDGTNTAAVKAASTAALATDPALVVAMSPNSSLPITAASLPLPTGAATEATLATRLADATFTGRINTFGQKVSASSTPVVIASDQSAVPVSGTVTSNIGTTGGLALDATITGGTQKAIARGGAKGSTVAADVTSTASGANHQPLDVAIYDASGNQITSFGGPQYADGAARGTATGTLLMVDDGTNIQSVSGDVAGRLNTNARITDGTNTATVKAASSAAVETDTALVVAVSPNNTVPISAAALPLPSGAATDATLATRVSEVTFTTRVPTLGAKTSANSTPVVLATDQAAISVADGGGSLTVDGAVTANIGTTNGLALDATITGGTARTRLTDGISNVAVKAASTAAVATDPALVVAISPNNTITTSNPSVGANNALLPTSSTVAGGSDGTNVQAVRVFDGDTGAGSQYVLGAILRKSASGGTAEAGTAADPLRIDPTGSTTQPISGTVTANLGTVGGLALDATLTGGTQKGIIRGGAKGATAAADVTSTAEGTDHQAVDVQLYHGGVAVNPQQTRALTSADVVTAAQGPAAGLSGNWPVRVTDGFTAARLVPASTAAVAADPALVVAISPNNSVAVTAAALPLPAGAATEATLATRLADATFTARTPTLGQKTAAGSSPVVLASDQSAVPVSGTITSNIGTTNGLALDATLTGGTQKAIARGGAKGSTVAADLTSTASGANHQPLDVAIYDGAGNQITTFAGQQYADGAARGTATGALLMVDDGTNIQSASGDTAGRLNTTARITDGVTSAAVKAASSAAVATDTALVVAVSPNNTVAVTAAALPLPTGAATEATLASRLAETTFTARVNTLGQKTAANSTPTVLASDQTPIPITDNAGSLTVDSIQLPAALVGGRLDANIGAWLGSTAPTVGQKTMANSLPVVFASDQVASPPNTTGTHANAWNAALTGVNGNSTAVDCQYTPYVSVFGSSDGATTLLVQVSQNNTNFYTIETIATTAAGDFGGSYVLGARYVRLQSSVSRTITATIAGKD